MPNTQQESERGAVQVPHAHDETSSVVFDKDGHPHRMSRLNALDMIQRHGWRWKNTSDAD